MIYLKLVWYTHAQTVERNWLLSTAVCQRRRLAERGGPCGECSEWDLMTPGLSSSCTTGSRLRFVINYHKKTHTQRTSKIWLKSMLLWQVWEVILNKALMTYFQAVLEKYPLGQKRPPVEVVPSVLSAQQTAPQLTLVWSFFLSFFLTWIPVSFQLIMLYHNLCCSRPHLCLLLTGISSSGSISTAVSRNWSTWCWTTTTWPIFNHPHPPHSGPCPHLWGHWHQWFPP